MATSLDGKIGPAGVDHFVAIGSRYDMENLISLRDQADGILFGASTYRTWPKVHWGHDRSKLTHHFIMSRSLKLDFNTELFQDQNIPITIFSGRPDLPPPTSIPGHVSIVSIPEGVGQIDSVLKHITACGVNSLLIEGGGHILNQFIEAQALQELFLTLTPNIIGDSSAPALLGASALSNPPLIHVEESRQVNNEVFLSIHLKYSAP